MREIIFDTETTGFSFADGDRMVEIGCVEVVNRVETGRSFHAYFHPERTMPPEAHRVHGLSDAFLADKPLFGHRARDLIAFIADSPLVAHNASFDFGFLNGEFTRSGHPPVGLHRMVDTILLARARHPGAKHSLDALCSRYGIDRSHRTVHGALLDAQLLAQVYVELCGGRQIGLTLVSDGPGPDRGDAPPLAPAVVRPARMFAATAEERARHAAFMATIVNPVWGPLWGVAASG